MSFQPEVEGNRCLFAGCRNGLAGGLYGQRRWRSRGLAFRATQIRNGELPRGGGAADEEEEKILQWEYPLVEHGGANRVEGGVEETRI